MQKFILLLLLFLGFSLESIAQNEIFDNYKPIESQGEVPKEFVTRFSDKVSEEIDDFVQGSDSKTKRYKTDFLVNSAFSTKKILLSGKVLFNDPVTIYINKVADKIFEANKDLDKSKFRIYAYKSPIVNAIAFNDGLVLINLGLIAQLENEAQLALILCHEFTHFVNNDAIELFLESKEIDNGTGIYSNTTFSDKMLYKSTYSQERETNADLEGLEYYKKTNYSLKPINGVFDVLKYSYLPFDDIAFDSSYFEFDNFIFPTEYKLKTINPISADGLENEDEDEEILKSHPGAEERRTKALDNITLSELKDESKQVYLASTEEAFMTVRNICRFEMPRMYLLYGYYEMAFYNAYMLEELGFKNNLYLDQMKAKSIGQMARKINTDGRPSKSRLKEIEDEIQGESQQIYYILNSIGRSKTEFNVFAVQYAYEMLLKHPADESLKDNFENLAYALFKENSIKIKDFVASKQKNVVEEDEPVIEDEEAAIAEAIVNEKSEKEKLMDEIRAKDSKYKKIEKKVEEEEHKDDDANDSPSKKDSDIEYYKFGFSKYLNDKTFKTTLKEKENEYKKSKEDNRTDREKKIESKNIKLDRNRGLALGIDKITIVNPIYFAVGENGSNAYKSEKGQEELNKILTLVGKKSKLEVDIIDVNKGDMLTTESFNNAAILNEWIGEQFIYNDPIEFTSIEKEKMQKLIKGYDSRYFLWTGVISYTKKRSTIIFNLLFDLETNEVKFNEQKSMRIKSSKTLLKSELYHVFDQVKTKRKL